MTNILLGVTGSVAAKLTPKMTKALVDANFDVKIVSTERGLFFIEKDLLVEEGLVINKNEPGITVPLYRDKDEWSEGGYHKEDPVPHIDLCKWADIMVIAPLTANTIADMATGRADKFLTSIVLAWRRTENKAMILAPAMNTFMWQNEITQINLNTFRAYYDNKGVNSSRLQIIDPVEGNLACGDQGKGAMAPIGDIVAEVVNMERRFF